MMLWMILTVMIALAAAGLTIPLVRRYEQRPDRARTLDILKGQLAELDSQQAGKLIAHSRSRWPARRDQAPHPGRRPRDREAAARPLPATRHALGGAWVWWRSSRHAPRALYALMGHPELTVQHAPPAKRRRRQRRRQPTPQHPMGEVATMIAGTRKPAAAESQRRRKAGRCWAGPICARGRPADAAKAYGRAAALDPGNAEYLSARGRGDGRSRKARSSGDARGDFPPRAERRCRRSPGALFPGDLRGPAGRSHRRDG